MYYADRARHLVCEPPTRAALLAMAAELGIGPHWYHAGRFPHIDIPKRDISRVLADPRVTIVSPRRVLAICAGTTPD